MATARPTAVATSASEMPAITVCWIAAPLAPMFAQIMEGLDDAEHRAEQPDERRVVAQRAEERQVALVLGPLARDRGGDDLLDGVRALVHRGQGLAQHRRLHALSLAHRGAHRLELPAGEPQRQLLGARQPVGEEVHGPLQHQRDGEHREHDEQPQHPLGAGERHAQQFAAQPADLLVAHLGQEDEGHHGDPGGGGKRRCGRTNNAPHPFFPIPPKVK